MWEDVHGEQHANHSHGNKFLHVDVHHLLLVFSNGWPTGRSPRLGRPHRLLRCRPAVARLEPGAGGPAAASVKPASGTSAENVTSAGT